MEIGQTLDLMPDLRVNATLMVNVQIENVNFPTLIKKNSTAFCNVIYKSIPCIFLNKQVVKMQELM